MTKCLSSFTHKSPAGEKGRKRGLSPEYKLRWIEQPKTRKSGWVDVFYIHKYVPNLICRSIRAVQMYEKYGILPRGSITTIIDKLRFIIKINVDSTFNLQNFVCTSSVFIMLDLNFIWILDISFLLSNVVLMDAKLYCALYDSISLFMLHI